MTPDTSVAITALPPALLDVLVHGARFTQHVRPGEARVVFVRYDPTARAFLVHSREADAAECASQAAPLQRMALDELTDIFVGKQQPQLHMAEERCLSLRSARISLDLEAEAAAVVDAWVEALQALLMAQGQRVLLQDEDEVIDADAALRCMEAGEPFTLLTLAADGCVTPLPVRLCYRPGPAESPMGHLTYGDEALPLHTLSDVFLGPQSAAFTALPDGPPTAEAASRCCMSLLFEAVQLDLIAPSEPQLNRWLAGINALLTRAGRSTVVEDAEVGRANGARSIEGAGDDEAAKGAECVERMRLGSVFSRFVLVDGGVVVERPLLRYEANDGGLGALVAPAAERMALASLTDVFVGQQTRTFALAPAAARSAALCFSLLSADAVWDLAADDEDTLSAWLSGIHHVLTSTGAQLEDTLEDAQQHEGEAAAADTPAVQPPQDAASPALDRAAEPPKPQCAAVRPSFSVVPTAAARSSSSLSASSTAAVVLLERGEWFDLLQPAGGLVQRAFVFLNPRASRMGCLYWTGASDSRDERVGQSLALHTLSDVLVGAKAAAAASAASWPSGGGHSADGCLSLLSKRERSSMHLRAAGGESVVKAWVRSIRSVLQHGGATVHAKDAQKQPLRQQPQPASAPEAASVSLATTGSDPAQPPPPSPPSPPSVPPTAAAAAAGAAVGWSLPVELRALLSPLFAPCTMSLISGDAMYPVSLCLSALDSCPLLTYRHLSPALSSSKPRRLTVRRITDLYLGFSAPSLSASAWARGGQLRAAAVWSVVTRRACWDLAAAGEDDRAAWVHALRSLILALTRKRVVEEKDDGDTDADADAGAAGPTAATRRVSFAPASAPISGAAALAALTSGLCFTLYQQVDGLTFKQPIVLFYRQRRAQGRLEDVLYWCDDAPTVDRSAPPTSPSAALPIDRISDVYLGKQTPLLSSASARAAQDEHCMALLAPAAATLELEALRTAPTACATLLAAITFICADAGRRMEEEHGRSGHTGASAAELAMLRRKAGTGASHKRFSLGPAVQSAAANRRMSVLSSSRLSMLAAQEDDPFALPTGAQLSALLQVGGEARLRGWSADVAAMAGVLSMMEDGRMFTGYTADSRGRFHQCALLLFLSPTPPCLQWCPYGMKQCHANASLPLSSLSALHLGKRTAALSSPLARSAVEERCLALQGSERALDVECKDERVLLAFLIGIDALLRRTGRSLQPEAGDPRRLLVVAALPEPPRPPPTPVVEAPLLSAPPRPSLRTCGLSFDLVSPASTTASAVTTLTSATPPSPSASLRRPVVVWSRGESLYWTEPTAPLQPVASAALPLRAIRDIYCGKTTAAMRCAELSSVADERCVSLVARACELNLVAAAASAARTFVAELMGLLQDSGKRVCDTQSGRSKAAAASPPPLPDRPTHARSARPAQGDCPSPRTALNAGGVGGGRISNKENRARQSSARRLSVLSSSTAAPLRVSLLRASLGQSCAEAMAQGRLFQLYTAEAAAGADGSVLRRLVHVSYHAASESLRLTAAQSPASYSSSVPLRALTEVVMGKQTALFTSAACSAVDRKRAVCLCMAAAGEQGEGTARPTQRQLHLEAESAAALSSWLFGLQALLSAQGKTVVHEAPAAAPGADEAGARKVDASSRRFSIVNRPPVPSRKPTRARLQQPPPTLGQAKRA